jgi:hypothetical protein
MPERQLVHPIREMHGARSKSGGRTTSSTVRTVRWTTWFGDNVKLVTCPSDAPNQGKFSVDVSAGMRSEAGDGESLVPAALCYLSSCRHLRSYLCKLRATICMDQDCPWVTSSGATYSNSRAEEMPHIPVYSRKGHYEHRQSQTCVRD